MGWLPGAGMSEDDSVALSSHAANGFRESLTIGISGVDWVIFAPC
jgi:hypothetical protein